MALNTDNLVRILDTLEQAISALSNEEKGSISFDLYRNAAIKSFELSLETTGKLLRKALKSFYATPREVDRLVFNDVLRQAGKYGLLDIDAVERWLMYRNNRNSTAHDYNEAFANETLKLLPDYLIDARALSSNIKRVFDEQAD